MGYKTTPLRSSTKVFVFEANVALFAFYLKLRDRNVVLPMTVLKFFSQRLVDQLRLVRQKIGVPNVYVRKSKCQGFRARPVLSLLSTTVNQKYSALMNPWTTFDVKRQEMIRCVSPTTDTKYLSCHELRYVHTTY